MRIGIYTHYAHCDEAYFAVRLADFLRTQGVTATIYSNTQPAKLNTHYDRTVVHKKKRSFTDWAKTCDTILWTHPPKIDTLNYTRRLNVRTILVPMWQELMRPFRKVMQRFDHVVALNAEARELFSKVYKLKNVTLIPFDVGLPATKKTKSVNGRQIKIFLPWFDRNARCAHSQFLGLLGYLLERMPDAQLTVAITSSRFAPSVAKFFQTLGRKTDNRVKLVRNVPLIKRPAMYTAHDLTLFPAECDNYGFCSLMSISCGTPVLSFNLSPQTDFVYQDANGVLVKTRVDYDENGVPHAAPDYEKLIIVLQTLIAEPGHIDNLNKRVNYNLAARRKAFEMGWQTLLKLV
ncbi:glycosyltransferase family 1 protein [bacterium]|nr:glycosyltransferase family 1 protein [Betaproteobacteria bacterium]NDE16925.1 glycosyltransferase family 1 protein [bacterium]